MTTNVTINKKEVVKLRIGMSPRISYSHLQPFESTVNCSGALGAPLSMYSKIYSKYTACI